MSILKIDDKWSVVYDPKSNDSPKMWMRHGDRHYPFDESNAVVAMFYALKEANAALTQSRAETAAAYERAAHVYIDGDWDWYSDADDAIRALATPDQTAALDKLIAEAVKPYVEALEFYETQFCEGFCEDMPDRSVTNEGMENDCSGCKARAILAASKKGGV